MPDIASISKSQLMHSTLNTLPTVIENKQAVATIVCYSLFVFDAGKI
ncbi:hypothetical protein SALWKB12_1949 [Snodgrassella communis]|uniref:Uncharacterized protein n=1 Tax=Snodgrassella communis TaxID=2946699 RepID=A0A836MNP2_9NEIS|nr:hypothetical protein SALWKB12_1949 [Snodgrassella communis]KDN14238.1 hypothetical protein SALWKB29_1728 [Snodgrassella communis]